MKRYAVCMLLLCALHAAPTNAQLASLEGNLPRPVHGRLEPRQSALLQRVVGNESRLVLRESEARFEITVPPNATLDVGFAAKPVLWRRGVEKIVFSIAFLSDGENRTLFEHRMEPERESRWHDVRISLQPVAGLTGSLELSVRITGGSASLGHHTFWSHPRIEPEPQGAGPSIVLISIDTLRPDHLGCYGYERDTSPQLDKMAAECVLFRQAISTSSWTLPAHASLFTGLHPSRHGATRFGNFNRLPSQLPALAEIFWDHGYRTIGITGGGFVSHSFGLARGFDRFSEANELDENVQDSFAKKVERAMRFVEDASGDRFFLFLHTYAVHAPYRPLPPYDRMFDPTYEGRFARAFDQYANPRYGKGDHDFDDKTIQHLEALYDAGIRSMDESLGRLLDQLRRSPPTRGVCVFVTSDHGEEFDEHGHILHSQPKLYEELIRIPLIAWCPGNFDGGRVVDAPVSLVDIMPTLLDIAGVPIPSGINGRSLKPALHGEPMAPVTIFSETDRSLIQAVGSVRSARTSRYKLILSSEPDTALLFDLERDRNETRDLSLEEAGIVTRLKHALESSRRTETNQAPAEPATPDAETMEQLRALVGYFP